MCHGYSLEIPHCSNYSNEHPKNIFWRTDNPAFNYHEINILFVLPTYNTLTYQEHVLHVEQKTFLGFDSFAFTITEQLGPGQNLNAG